MLVNKTCEPKKYSSLKSLCLQIFSGTRIHDAVVFPFVTLYKYMPAMWTIPDVSATEEKKLFSFFPRITRGCLTGTQQLSWEIIKKQH
jgi:hypothetical protein